MYSSVGKSRSVFLAFHDVYPEPDIRHSPVIPDAFALATTLDT